jgi:4-amino-4-deoxy-L-arabinose transferase-like glycosyltransferase
MQNRKFTLKLSSTGLVILAAALVKFGIHLYTAPGYTFFIDEFYTAALSRHLAFGYVDLPPLVPALMALSRALLGESLLAMHIFPALAGAFTLVFICLITREFGGKTFAVALSALGFMGGTLWLSLDSIFAYDSIDQLVLAGFLFAMARFLRTGNRRLWIVIGLLAGLALNTKMTLLFMGPGFLAGLLISKYRRDLLTRWPWLGAGLCVLLITPYLLWQAANGWPTLEYWTAYGSARVYQISLQQYFINILVFMSPFLLPLWVAGLYRIFRPFGGTDKVPSTAPKSKIWIDNLPYAFFGILFLVTLVLLFSLHASIRLLAASFIPLVAAGAVFYEELISRITARIPWQSLAQAAALLYLAAAVAINAPVCLPIFPIDSLPGYTKILRPLYQSTREFNGEINSLPMMLAGRLGWDQIVEQAAQVYNELPEEDRAVAGVYTDWYWTAGAVDMLGPRYGLPHAVSGSLTYYLWGPGYSWDVMLLITSRTNPMSVFFETCENKGQVRFDSEYLEFYSVHLFVCRQPKVPAETIWSSAKLYR